MSNLVQQREAVEEAFDRFEKNRTKDYCLTGHDIGIHDLNLMMGGLIPKKLTTIAARSGIGKTALTVPMFQAGSRILANRRAEFLFFTWEMAPSYLVDRDVCNRTGLTNRMLMQGVKLLPDSKVKEIRQAYELAAKLPVTYQEQSTNFGRVKHLFDKFCSECDAKSKIEGIEVLPVLVIDYIGMANFEDQGKLRTYGIGDFMNGLKRLINETGGCAVVLAQINRTADEKGTPQKKDLSDSQSIENASDNLILLHRPEHYNVETMTDPDTREEIDSRGKMLLRAAKGRDFGTGDRIVSCDIKTYRFWSRNHSHDLDYWNLYEKEDFWMKLFGFK